MKKVCTKLVAKVLTDDQKNHRIAVVTELLERLEMEPDFLDCAVTGDETWVAHIGIPETKKARMSKLKVKTLLIICFNAKDVIHKEFVPQGHTVNSAYYDDMLERLKKGRLSDKGDRHNLGGSPRQRSKLHRSAHP